MTKTVLLYAVATLAVVGLSSVYPKIAIYLVLLLILGVLAQHGTEYAAMLSGVSAVSNGQGLATGQNSTNGTGSK